jgi:hypothetical protein
MLDRAPKFNKLSTKDEAQTPEKAYNINDIHFLRVDKSVPFDLDDVYFTWEILGNGIYFKVCQERSS